MKHRQSDSAVPPDVIKELAMAIAPAELTMEQRARLRGRVLARADDTAPEGTRTLRARDSVWVEIAPFIEARILRIDEAEGTYTSIMRMRAGGVVPAHRHSKPEEFIVLEGECCIGTHRLTAGDVHLSEAGSWHEAVTTQEGVVVLLRGEYPFAEATDTKRALDRR
jgi:quercetin dioxygenase-like cupin family protein